MPARFAVERRDWQAAAALEPRSPAYLAWDRYWWPEALSWFARGLGAVHTGDLDTARQAERRMIALRDRARDADETGFATYIEVDRLILDGAARAARAARAAHDPARAGAHYAALLEVVGASGAERDGIREARDFGR
jgi:hypothetical protein